MKDIDVRVCFFGDSFTAGTGDPEALGWVGRVVSTSLERGYRITAYNLGIRRETSRDIQMRWEAECAPRTKQHIETRVVFSFGANDVALEDNIRRLTLDETLTYTADILQKAQSRHPTLLIGPPPMAISDRDQRIGELSQALPDVAAQHGVPYLDVFTPLNRSNTWREEVINNDGRHPRSGGYRQFANLVLAWDGWWFK